MKKVSCYIVICISVVAIVGCTLAQRGAMSRARAAIEKKDYGLALQKLSQAEKYAEPTPELKAEIVYLRATCYEGLKSNVEAIGALKYLIDKFPNTSYAYQAKEKLRKLEERN